MACLKTSELWESRDYGPYYLWKKAFIFSHICFWVSSFFLFFIAWWAFKTVKPAHLLLDNFLNVLCVPIKIREKRTNFCYELLIHSSSLDRELLGKGPCPNHFRVPCRQCNILHSRQLLLGMFIENKLGLWLSLTSLILSHLICMCNQRSTSEMKLSVKS